MVHDVREERWEMSGNRLAGILFIVQKSINMNDTHPGRQQTNNRRSKRRRDEGTDGGRNIGYSRIREVCDTHVDHIRDVMDVILGHHRVGRCQVQQVVVPGFCALQLVLRVLGLSLEGADAADQVWKIRDGRANQWERALERTPPAISIRIPAVLVSF